MSGIARTSTHVSPLSRRRPGTGTLGDEHKSRRHGGDFSHLAPILPESDRSPSPAPGYSKDLPRIPSTSTGLWGGEAVSILTEVMGSLTASPIPGCPPLPVHSHHVYERVPITEAQQIAVQYRRRFRSPLNTSQSTKASEQMTPDVSTDPPESSHASPTSTVMQSGVSTDTQVMNALVGASLALSESPTRRALAEEIKNTRTLHDSASSSSQVHEDGTLSCTRGDCLAVLSNFKAFLCHLHIHLIHEGLNSCEHCRTLFTDDDHKDDHLNSCPKLPTLHDIRSLESGRSGGRDRYYVLSYEPPALTSTVGTLQGLLRRLHP